MTVNRRLVIRREDGSESAFPVAEPFTTVGRAADNLIQLASRRISRHHAVIRREDDKWVVEDKGSKNGLKVNDKERTRAVITHGDRIALGPYSFAFEEVTPDTPFPPFNAHPGSTVRSAFFRFITGRRAEDTVNV